jgi:hypothetical protein
VTFSTVEVLSTSQTVSVREFLKGWTIWKFDSLFALTTVNPFCSSHILTILNPISLLSCAVHSWFELN